MQIEIDSLEDVRVAAYRSLQDSSLRVADAFVVEGRLNVRLLIESAFEVSSVFVTRTGFDALAADFERLPADTPVYIARKDVLDGVVGFPMHRGCVALARRSAPFELAHVVRAAGEGSRLCLLLEDLTDQENVGACFRNAMAFGAEGVLLSPRCCDPLLRKATRVSMGGSLRVPFARAEPWPGSLETLREAGFELVALHPADTAQPLERVAHALAARPVALVVGSEGPGLSAPLLDVVDRCARIEIAAGVDSVNVGSAAAIALHAFAHGRLR